MSKPNTSWGGVADWYHEHLSEGENTYQRQVVLPNLLRLVEPAPGKTVADIACGQGFFAREFARAGATVVGSDIAPELIKKAKAAGDGVTYQVAPAHQLGFIADRTIDVATVVLALQNIAEVKETFAEVKRILKPDGRLILVLNHPAFRAPKRSGWGWDEENQIQYRRVDGYLHESQAEIQMHPGADPDQVTVSFHRPLQWYFKLLTNQGFAITRLEEWISHRESEAGPRKAAEDRARKEIPLFLCLEASQFARQGAGGVKS